MLTKFFLVIAVLLVSGNLYAVKEALIIGGGGEPAGSKTIFDGMYQNFMQKTSEGGWKTQSVFDGGHSDSESLANKLSGNSNSPMNIQNVDAAFENIKRRLATGELKIGDSLMIMVATHGAPNKGETTHSVSTSDGEISLDKINQIKELAEAQGVKLAVLDMSCYSGNSQKIASDKTCVISAASSATVGYSNTGHFMAGFLNKGESLESSYLKMRNFGGAPSTPMISTEAGKKAGVTSSVLAQDMVISRQLTENSCGPSSESQLNKVIANLRAVNNGVKDNLEQELTVAVEKYQSRRAAIEKEFKDNETKNRTCVTLSGQKVCERFEVFEVYAEFSANTFGKEPNAEVLKARQVYKSVLSSPEYILYKQNAEGFKAKADSLQQEANQVAQIERQIYNKIYEKESAKSKAPNPCKDFVL